MTIQEMIERKQELGYTNEMISSLSSVPLSTVQKIFAGVTKTPRRSTLLALESILQKNAPISGASSGMDLYGQAVKEWEQKNLRSMVAERAEAYGDPRQGTYTIDDYYALPDERRVELIDGYIYDMSSPSRLHQQILGQLYLLLAPCVEKHPECEIYFAPADVRLDNDDWTMVQPDLYIVCHQHDNDPRRLNGAPDFVIEILSPSSRTHDMFRKLNKYRGANVREYWIIDPDRQWVTVYDLEHEEPPVTYTFSDTVPVRISNGECSVDFAQIRERLRRFYENE